jgi:hypothetical protein
MILTLHKSHTQFPVGTRKKRPPGDSQSARQRDIALGAKVSHDGCRSARTSRRWQAQRCDRGADGPHAPGTCPVMQSSSGASRLGGGGDVGRAARMNHGDIQQGGTMGREKGHLNVGPHHLTANHCNAKGNATGLCTRITARVGGDAAESFLPVVVPMRAAPAQAMAAHGVVDIAALDVMTTKTSGGGDMWVGASSAKADNR